MYTIEVPEVVYGNNFSQVQYFRLIIFQVLLQEQLFLNNEINNFQLSVMSIFNCLNPDISNSILEIFLYSSIFGTKSKYNKNFMTLIGLCIECQGNNVWTLKHIDNLLSNVKFCRTSMIYLPYTSSLEFYDEYVNFASQFPAQMASMINALVDNMNGRHNQDEDFVKTSSEFIKSNYHLLMSDVNSLLLRNVPGWCMNQNVQFYNTGGKVCDLVGSFPFYALAPAEYFCSNSYSFNTYGDILIMDINTVRRVKHEVIYVIIVNSEAEYYEIKELLKGENVEYFSKYTKVLDFPFSRSNAFDYFIAASLGRYPEVFHTAVGGTIFNNFYLEVNYGENITQEFNLIRDRHNEAVSLYMNNPQTV